MSTGAPTGAPNAAPSITVFGMRPLFKPTLTVGAAVLLATTACTDDTSNAQDTAPSTTQPSPEQATEPTRESDGVLTIGVLLPQTGEGSSIGNPGIAAASVAVEAINREGGVLGQPVQLVRADEGGTLAEAQVGVDLLLSQHVDAVVGPGSSIVALNVLDQLMAAGVVTCSPTATTLALDDYPNRELFFRTVPSDSLAAEGIAVQAQRTGVTAATIVYIDDAFGRPFAREVRRLLNDRGLEIAGENPLDPESTDYSDDARQLAESPTGTIILIADSAHGWAMLSAMAEVLDDPPKIIVNDALRRPPSIDQVVALSEPFRTAIEGVSPLGNPQQPDDEPTGPFATNSYDCVNLIALASLVAESDDPQQIAANIRSVANRGASCFVFALCTPTIADDLDVDYNGPRRLLELGADGDPARGPLMLFGFDSAGVDLDLGLVRISD